MTLTFNPEKYKEVLSEYQPRLIKTEAENEHALAIVEQLMNSPDLSPEQEEIYELLVILIERFEEEFYKPDRSKNSGSMLSFLMDQRDKNKPATNLGKHGIDFADAVSVFSDDLAITTVDERFDEERFITIGLDALGRLLVVVYTWRDREIRLISARLATRQERRQYEEG
jgi:uncharacterized protein